MPNRSKYTAVKDIIPTLTQAELKDLFNRCKLLLRNETDTADWLLEGILDELRNIGVIVPSFDKIKKLHSYNSFSEKSDSLRAMLEDQGITTKLEKRQLSLICTKCMIEYLKSFTDVSLQNIMQYIDYLPQALERAFPGYLSSRMLPFIVKSGTYH